MESRSIPAIALHTSNDNGGHYFMNLETGKRMHSYIWNEVPITEGAIQAVHDMAKKEKQSPLFDGELQFEWSDGINIDDEYVATRPRHIV